MSFNLYNFQIVKRAILPLLVFLLLVSEVSAQLTFSDPGTKLSQIVPPSPNAASLAKYGNIPVSYHTGLPKVNIPIYQWGNKNAGLEFSASLDYHAGGVKVDEIASNVGLGWALNAGGAISRTMRGLPDESTAGFLNTDTIPNIGTVQYLGQYLYGQSSSVNTNYPSTIVIKNPNSNFGLVSNIYNNTLDSQQDIFYFNFNGKSGKFFIGKNGAIVTQQKDNFKITKISSGGEQLSSFQVIDDQGNTYVFDQKEITTSYRTTYLPDAQTESTVPVSYTSSWYLSSIKSPGQEYEIKLEYAGYEQNYTSGFSEFKSYNESDDYATTGYDGQRYRTKTSTNSTIQIWGKTIKKISFPDSVKLNFDYSTTPRSDVNGDYPLAKVTIMQNGKSKGFNLQQSYFDNGNTAISTYLRRRLRLDQVTEFGGSTSITPQKFYYNELALPERGSPSQDYWGYPVSPARNNTTLIPKMNYFDPSLGFYNPFNEIMEGSNREVDSVYVKSASLYRIDYPTGGQTIFDFECNDDYNTDFGWSDAVTNSVTLTQYTTNTNVSLGTITATGTVAQFKLGLTESGPRPPNDPPAYFPEDIENQPVSFILKKTDNSWSSTIFNGTYSGLLSNSVIFNTTIPGSGNYNIYMQYANQFGINFLANVTAKYYVEKNRRQIGGLRIKNISDKTSVSSSLINTRKFEYRTTDNKSSGKEQVFPMYDIYKTVVDAYTGGTIPQYINSTEILNRTAESTQPLGSIQGSPVGYSRVVVSDLPGNGKTVYEYTPLAYYDYYTHYPYSNGEYITWGAGLPTKEYTYDGAGALIRSVDQTYQLVYSNYSSAYHRSLTVGQVYTDNYNTNTRKGYTTTVSYPVLGYANLTQKTEREYSGSTYVQKQTNLAYDSNYNLLVSSNTTTNRGIQTERYYYPFQYTGVPVFVNMTTANILNRPIKQEIWRTISGSSQEFLVSGQATSYTTLGYHAKAFRPLVDYTYNTINPIALNPVTNFSASTLLTPATGFEAKINYDNYSSDKGILKSYTLNSFRKNALIWGNNQLYIKASIDNAADNEVFYQDFEDSAATTGNAHTGNRYNNATYSVSWTIPNAKAYTLSYWYLDAGIWKLAQQAYTGSVVLNSGTAIDDVLIRPTTSMVNTYYMNPLTGLVSQTDQKGKTSYFEFDEFFRLKASRDRNGYLLKTNIYHYQP